MKNEMFFDGLVFGGLPEGMECLGTFDGNGFAKAKKDGRWGYVDRSLIWAVPPMFDDVRGMYAGDRTEVKKDMKWEFIGRLRMETSVTGRVAWSGSDPAAIDPLPSAPLRLAA